MNSKVEKVVIIGAGLCGTLMGIRLAQRGYQVKIYEKRPDLRTADISAGRSINLALSDRGFAALDMVGMMEDIKPEIIPMLGRLIHKDGETTLYRYSGREAHHINSISRGGLNIKLLEKADSYDNVQIYFNVHCTKVDIESNTIWMSDSTSNYKITADLIIGADGAGSAVRHSFQAKGNVLRFSYSQNWLDTGYKELSIQPDANGNHQIEKNALHIWPRDGFMMIALPNNDGSFTLTLFIPFEGKNSMEDLQTPAQIQAFYEEHFPDIIDLMPDLISEFQKNPTSALGTVRCYPWGYGRVLLLGDAAHAIVPFYGQGMNCAFEDCVVLDKLIDDLDGDWDKIISNYQVERKPDADAIAALAEENFFEMRDATADSTFNTKRIIELKLEKEFDDYHSKYSQVTFRPDIPYHQAMTQGRLQNKILLDMVKDVKDVEALDLDSFYDEFKSKIREFSNVS